MWIACSKSCRTATNCWRATFSKISGDLPFGCNDSSTGFDGNIIVPFSETLLHSQRRISSVCSDFGTKAQRSDFHWGQSDAEEDNFPEVRFEEAVKKGTGNDGRERFQTGRLSRKLMQCRSDQPVVPLLKDWVSEGNPLPKNIVIVALTNLKRNHRYKQALELADYAWRERLFQMDEVDHMYRLYLTGQVGSIEDVEKCFEGIPSECLTETVYNQLISCYIARGMVSDAKSALEKLRNMGKPFSALPYNQFMALYRHERQPKKALELLQEMNAANILPNTRTYNLLLSVTLKQGDADGAIKIYKAMGDANVTADAFTYSLVARAYITGGLTHEAESVATEMQKVSNKNCHLTHDLLLTLYAEQGNRHELQKLWKHMQSFSDLSSRSYGVMIECLGKLGQIQEAEDLAMKAERKKGKLVSRVFNAMMDVYARHGMMKAAEDLMIRIRKDRLRPNAVTYKYLITGYLREGQIEKALGYLRTSRENLTFDPSKPWFDSFLLVLESLAERGDVEAAEDTFEVFTSVGSYRRTTVYNNLLKAYVKAKRLAPNFLQRMSADGIQPDAETLALLAEIESLYGGVKEASSK